MGTRNWRDQRGTSEERAGEKQFREDLFHRLSVVTIALPTLRERAEDIPALVRFFIQRYARQLAVELPSIQPEALGYLQLQPWPGNVRELENVVRQALLLAKLFGIGLEHVRQVVEKFPQHSDANFQTHAHYVSELLAAAQRGEVVNVHARMIHDLEPELFKQGHPARPGQSGQGRPLARRHAAEDAGEARRT